MVESEPKCNFLDGEGGQEANPSIGGSNTIVLLYKTTRAPLGACFLNEFEKVDGSCPNFWNARNSISPRESSFT
jgi:hypothetical protein